MVINFNDTQIEIPVNDDSYRNRSIMDDNSLTLFYSLPEHVEIPTGAWTEFQGRRYELMSPENFKKHGTRNFEYTLILEAEQAKLKKYKFKDTTSNRLKFSLTATPQIHIQMLVENLNARETGWEVGEIIEAVEQVISYNHTNCLDALTMMADAFHTEWEIDGKKIHLRKTEYYKDNPLPLSYGRGNGFKPGVGRMNADDSNPVEVLFVQGGTRNIDPSRYGGNTELLLPKSRQLLYEGRMYVSDADGYSLRRADKDLTTGVEDSLDCSHIYPGRVGTISQVIVVDAEKHFYDIIDNSIPENLNYSQYRIAGEKATIVFNDGMLAGKEFDIEQTEEALTGYIHTERRFKIVPQDIDGYTMPDSTFTPFVGQKYAIFGIALPDAYISDNATQTGASWDMFREGAKYLYEHEDARFTFTGELDGIWAKKNWLEIGGRIRLGGYILFSDAQFQPEGVLIRMTGIKDFINRPHSPVIELSNVTAGISVSSQLKKIETDEVLNEYRAKAMMLFTKRQYADAKEAQEMLEKALGNFSPGIDPIWVRTMSVLVGNEYQQFEFVNNKTNSQVEIVPNFVMNNTTKIFTAPVAILKHMTMGIESTSYVHDASEYKYWDMAAYTSPFLGDDTSSYYFVAKCAKSGTAGAFLLQKEYRYEPGDGYYYFLVGLLSSERSGERSFASAYGYTEILPGQMRIKMIISPDGKTYFNVAKGEIGGNIRILAGSSGYNNLSDKPDLSVYSTISEFNVLSDRITANVTQITSIGNRITSIEQAGFMTTAQGNTLYASKTLEDGTTIISKINQTPTAVTIDASHINLVGKVTFSMLDGNAQSTINGKANTSGLKKLAYEDFVELARLGSTIIEGGHIKTSLIEADYIFANYAYLGGFTLTDGWFTCNASPGKDVGYIDMRSSNTRIAFGRELAPGVAGGSYTCTALVSNKNNAAQPGGETIALSLEASGDSDNEIYAIALVAKGGVRIKGGMSVVEESVLNEPISVKNLKLYRCFAYQTTAGTYVDLPSSDDIQTGFGYLGNGLGVGFKSFIRIHILITRWATSYIRLRAPSSTPLVDQNGSVVSYKDMEKGDYCELTYHNGAWYLTAFHN
ncbi:MAG: hypothetical protein LBC19_04175 [Tannerella sp.]|jgi:hypothetical protein|nr:hypothetical protein [Tannerella sp.]